MGLHGGTKFSLLSENFKEESLARQRDADIFGSGANQGLSNLAGTSIPNPPRLGNQFRTSLNPDIFRRRTEARIDAILRQLDIDAESVAANFNARGLSRAGGREEAIFQTLSSGLPAVAGAIAEGELGFQSLGIQADLQALGISTQQFLAILNLIGGLRGAEIQADAASDASLFGGIGSIVGAGLGFAAAGPAGAAAGSRV